MHQNHNFITINIVAALHFWTIFIPIFDSFIDVTKNIPPFFKEFVIFVLLLTFIFCGIFFLQQLNGCFIMNFVSNFQFFSLERCNKAIPDWDDRRRKRRNGRGKKHWDDSERSNSLYQLILIHLLHYINSSLL